MNDKILKLFNEYAAIYNRFEDLQENKDNEERLLPGGDQKTGVIAEYYAKCYIQSFKSKVKSVAFAESGEPYDILYSDEERTNIRVQVKGVSAFSKTRVIAPLNIKVDEATDKKPFDELFLIDLDVNFEPIGFYKYSFEVINERAKIKKNDRIKVVGSTMRGTYIDRKGDETYFDGSRMYDFDNSPNEVNELRVALGLTPLSKKI